MQAQRGSRGIAYSFFNFSARLVWGGQHPGRDLVHILQEAGLILGPVWRMVENLPPTEFDSRTVQPLARCYTDLAIPAQDVLSSY